MPDQPRVLLCSFDVVPSPTGTSWRLSESIKALAPHFQTVALTLKTPDVTHIESYQGARLLRVPVTGTDLEARIETFARAVRRQLESEEYALVHFTDPFSGQVLCEERARPGYRLIFDCARFPSAELSSELLDVPDARRFLARLKRRELYCLMNADVVTTASPLSRTFLESLGVPPNGIQVMRSPVNLTMSTSPPPTAEEGLRVVYAGSAAPWQGLPLLLEAVAAARKEVLVQLIVIGPEHAGHTPDLRVKAEALGLLPDGVRFEPALRHEQLALALGDADLGVLPLTRGERNEVTGAALSKVSDYLAAGRGVIAADVPAARALLSGDVAAFFRPEEPEALAELLVELARAPARRVEMGLRARRFAEENLGPRTFRRRLRDLALAMLGIASAPPDSANDLDERTQLLDEFGPTVPRRQLKRTEVDERTLSEGLTTDPELAVVESTPSKGVSALPAEPPTAPPAPGSPSENGEAEPLFPAGPLDPWQALVIHGYCPPPTRSVDRSKP